MIPANCGAIRVPEVVGGSNQVVIGGYRSYSIDGEKAWRGQSCLRQTCVAGDVAIILWKLGVENEQGSRRGGSYSLKGCIPHE